MNRTVLMALAATLVLLWALGATGFMRRRKPRSLTDRAADLLDKANERMSDTMESIRDQATDMMSEASSRMKRAR